MTVIALTASADHSGSENLSERAYAAIKRAIVTCELAPGQAVSEAQLAERFGFGKAPIRAALSRLSQDRLVAAQARRGYRVAPVTLRDVKDIFELREVLEAQAARLAAGNVDAAELEQLDAACQIDYRPGDRDSATRFLDVNRSFHLKIAERSGNARLAAMLEQLMIESERLLHIGLALRPRAEEIRHEHEVLIDALISGRGEEAARVAAEQVRDAHAMVRDAILSSEGIASLAITLEPTP